MAGKVGPLSRFYNRIIGKADNFVPTAMRPFWEHPAGPKTVFFWAPLCKWSLVVAGISDLKRPANTLSLNQCAILGITGVIWSRWALVIIPKNWSLFAANVTVAITQLYQCYRAIEYEENLKNKSAN